MTIHIYKDDEILSTYFNNKPGIEQFLYQNHSHCDNRGQSVRYFYHMCKI